MQASPDHAPGGLARRCPRPERTRDRRKTGAKDRNRRTEGNAVSYTRSAEWRRTRRRATAEHHEENLASEIAHCRRTQPRRWASRKDALCRTRCWCCRALALWCKHGRCRPLALQKHEHEHEQYEQQHQLNTAQQTPTRHKVRAMYETRSETRRLRLLPRRFRAPRRGEQTMS